MNPLEKLFSQIVGLLFIMLIYSCAIFQQTELDKKWPQKRAFIDRFDFDRYLVKEGYIVTQKNDTLKWYFKIEEDYDEFNREPKPIPFLLFNKTKVSDIIYLKLNEINYIRSKLPKSIDSVDYIPYQSAICMLLGREGKMSILYHQWYKTVTSPDGATYPKTNEIILVASDRPSHKTTIMSHVFSLHTRLYVFLQFINDRYSQHFMMKDFKDEKSMVNYILDQENE